MKVVELCGSGHCPVIKIKSEQVEIGEKGNSCILTKDEWEVLRQKIINGELQTREPGATCDAKVSPVAPNRFRLPPQSALFPQATVCDPGHIQPSRYFYTMVLDMYKQYIYNLIGGVNVVLA